MSKKLKPRGPGRPRAANPRRNRITTSYTDAELKVLTKAAKGDLPSYVRDAALFRAHTSAE